MLRVRFRYLAFSVVALLGLLLSGCTSAGRHSIPATNAQAQPSAQQALLIVLRPSTYGGAIASSLFDVSTAESQLLGIVGAKEQMAFLVAPGKHRFMVIAESADFMEADLLGGRTYYAIITPRMGIWKARFSLHPFKQVAGEREFGLAGGSLREWLTQCAPVQPGPDSADWARANAASVQAKRNDATPKWEAMLEQDKRWRRLEPQDVLDGPVQ